MSSEQAGAIQGWRMNGAKNLRIHLVSGPDGLGEYGIFMGRVFEWVDNRWNNRDDLLTRQKLDSKIPNLEIVRR